MEVNEDQSRLDYDVGLGLLRSSVLIVSHAMMISTAHRMLLLKVFLKAFGKPQPSAMIFQLLLDRSANDGPRGLNGSGI